MLTNKELRVLPKNAWLSDGGPRGAGTLIFRRTEGGVKCYFKHTQSNGKRYSYPLGAYDENGKHGLTLSEARKKAGELSKLYASGIKDLREHFDNLEAKAKEELEFAEKLKEEQQQAQERAIAEKQRYTLRHLCQEYSDHLKAQGKNSYREAESAFRVHVFSNVDIANLPAREVTSDHVATLIRAIQEKGKTRMAGLTRTYLMAAYGVASKARYNALLPASLIEYGITSNPVSIIPNIPIKAGERTLSKIELQKYISELQDDNIVDMALLLSLMSGGQRIKQILRLRVNDCDDSGITLLDPKGRRAIPRPHFLPLGPRGKEIVEKLIKNAVNTQQKSNLENDAAESIGDRNPSLFPSNGTTVNNSTLGHRIKKISDTMQNEPFNARDIRRTVETLMASIGISKDIRAQILSHGLSGVQNKHYDKWEYLEEKKAALIKWENAIGETE